MKKNPEFLEIKDQGPVRWISLNRPGVKNAFNLEMGHELLIAVRQALHDKSAAVLVLSGKGDSFSAGGDIKGMSRLKNNAERKRFFLEISRLVHNTVLEIHKGEKPVIAATPGYVGGVALGLFLSADLRVATPNASMSAATIGIGLVANGGSTYFLPRLVGWGRAAEILLTGEKIGAERALQIGLINRVTTPEALVAETQKLAEQLSMAPKQALGRLKKILQGSWDASLPVQLERERQAIAWSSTTPDFLEGIAAFLAKRRPNFSC